MTGGRKAAPAARSKPSARRRVCSIIALPVVTNCGDAGAGISGEAPPTARATLLAHQPCLAQTITTLMSAFSAAVQEASLAPGPTRKG